MGSFRDIIEAIGIPECAKLLGVEESHIRVMKARNSIPAEYWGVLVEHCPVLSFAELRSMREARFSRNPADTIA